jgi:hypothetical protein
MANPTRRGSSRQRIKRGPGQTIVEGRSFRLADEVGYIQRRAAERDGRMVTFGQLALVPAVSHRRYLSHNWVPQGGRGEPLAADRHRFLA